MLKENFESLFDFLMKFLRFINMPAIVLIYRKYGNRVISISGVRDPKKEEG